jgi:hypothetical protein
VPGPGEYRPDPTAGIHRVEDLPKPKLHCMNVADRESSASFDRDHGANRDLLARSSLNGARSCIARHALKCAGQRRTQDVALRSMAWTGRLGVQGQ